MIPDASLSLVNDDTAISRNTTASAGGYFTFPLVVPGRYALRAQRDGFAPVQFDGLIVNVGDTLDMRLTLKVGSVTDTVAVTAVAPSRLDTAISTVVNGAQLHDLPIDSRGFQRLMTLAPGMVTSAGRGTPSNPAVSGTRNTSNNFAIDGMSANEERTGVVGLAPGSPSGLAVPDVVSTEALQEFRVVTSNADATFGRGAGAQVDIVTKSGTNALRGSAYEYFRHNRMDARNFFNRGPYFNDRGDPIPPPMRYNLFGATVGGPIARDRHFFFASYEGFRQRENLVANNTLPNADLMGLVPGDLGQLFRMFFLDTGFVPAAGNPAGDFRPFPVADRSAAIAAGFPVALFDGDPLNGEAGVVVSSIAQPREYVQNAALVRTDHRLGGRVMAAARYIRTRNVFERFLGQPGLLVNTTREFDSGLGQVTATLTSNQVVEARAGWLWNRAPTCVTDIPEGAKALGLTQLGREVSVLGTTGFALPYVSQSCTFADTQTVPQASAVHTWTAGAFTLRSGIDIRVINMEYGNLGLASPGYQFTGLVGPTGLLGASPSQAQSVASAYTATYFGGDGLPSTPLRNYRSLQQEYFAQADWRATPRLTLNLGVRYTIFGPYDIDGASNLFAVNANGAVVPDVSPFEFGRTANRTEQVGSGRQAYQRDANNVQPRVGAAWDPWGSGRTVVKGAYGIYHDRLFQFGFANLVVNQPFALSGSASGVPFTFGDLPALNPNTPGVFAIDPAIRNPYFHRTSIGVDQQLGRGTSVFAGYVGTFGRDLARVVDLNFGAGFPQAARPDPRFAQMAMLTNISTSRYHALQVHLRANPGPGVSATVAYTYSRFHDYTFADTIGGGQQIPTAFVNEGASAAAGFQVGTFREQPVAAYAGRSDMDLPHALAVSHLIELPFGRGRRWGSESPPVVDALLGGWALSGVLQARSGVPINVTLGRDVNDDGYVTDRPVLLSGSLEDLYARSGSKTQYLISQAEALSRLGVAADVTDPFAPIPYNALRAAAVWAYDVSLRKQVQIGGRVRVAIELNAFNVFNRTNLAAPNANLSSALFGTITSTVPGMGARQLQLGAKLTF